MTSRDRGLRPIRRKRRDHDLARTPKLGPLPLLGAGAVLGALVGAAGLYLSLASLLGLDWHPVSPDESQWKLPIADQQKLLADLVKIALGLAAGIGAAFALVVGYRRARVEEASSHRDDRRLFSSRYQDAAELMGSDKPAVRLAGIYAMARLADDWDEQQQQCVAVLCAYLRMPYDPATSEPGEREVRLTVIRLITAHLRAGQRSWRGRHLDFTGAVFDGGVFLLAEFFGGWVDFTGAKFSGGEIDFAGAVFAGGATVKFTGAKFSGATVDFTGAKFSGGSVDLSGAILSAEGIKPRGLPTPPIADRRPPAAGLAGRPVVTVLIAGRERAWSPGRGRSTTSMAAGS
jgi:uncharacterized protein YjbI with pentapeptide repeats